MRRNLIRTAAFCGAILIPVAVQAAQFLAAPNGMTLYVFAKDQNGVSSCYDDCAKKWPPFLGKKGEMMPEGWKLIQRTDGTMQWSYDNKPTYFYIEDKMTGETKGDGIGNVWSVIRQ